MPRPTGRSLATARGRSDALAPGDRPDGASRQSASHSASPRPRYLCLFKRR